MGVSESSDARKPTVSITGHGVDRPSPVSKECLDEKDGCGDDRCLLRSGPTCIGRGGGGQPPPASGQRLHAVWRRIASSPRQRLAYGSRGHVDRPNGFGGVDFAFPAGLQVSQLSNLATDYKFVAGSCGLGSPRFVATVTNGTATGNINFYIGPPPNYNSCPPNVYGNTGNLAAPTDLVDDSQLPGGTFYDPYAAAQSKYGSYTVTDVFLAVDGSNQTVDFDNSQVNNELFTYESAASCKDGGWSAYTASPGPFDNQGQCVRYFNNGK